MRVTMTLLALMITCSLAHGEDLLRLAEECVEGPHEQPQAAFAVYVFCDSALGTNIGVVLNDLNAVRNPAQWAPANRFWQSSEWATDVTSLAWDPTAHYLFVATGSVYGSGKIYRLDLVRRTHSVAFEMGELDQAVIEREARTVRAEAHMAVIEAISNTDNTIDLAIRLLGDGQSVTVGRKALSFGE